MRRFVGSCVIPLFLLLSACGYVRVQVTAPPPTATVTAPVRLATPELRATLTQAPSTPLPTATSTPTPTPIVHVVAKGDNLLAISFAYDVSLQALIEINAIENPRILSIGQQLIIPREEGSLVAAPSTPTPTPMPLEVVHLAFHRTPVGSLWCMGEVQNRRDEYLEVVQLQVTLYDVDGQRVAEAQGFTVTDVVPGAGLSQAGRASSDRVLPGRAPFALLVSDSPSAGFASYEVVIVGAEPIVYWGDRHRELMVEEIRWQMDQGTLIVRGMLRNAGQVDATAIRVTGTAYGDDGMVVGVRQVDVEPLAAGERRMVTLSLIPAMPVARVEAVAWGSESE